MFTRFFIFTGNTDDDCLKRDPNTVSSSPKMMSLWNRAIESSKALLLDKINLGPDALLEKVEEFEGISQATVYSYPAVVLSSEDRNSNSRAEFDDSDGHDSEDYSEDDIYSDEGDNEKYFSDSYEEVDSSVPLGSLPVDQIAEQLSGE